MLAPDVTYLNHGTVGATPRRVLAAQQALRDEIERGPAQFMLPLFTVLAILGLPFVALGLASQRDAAESRLRRAIRVALLDEAERLPPPQRWEDEDV